MRELIEEISLEAEIISHCLIMPKSMDDVADCICIHMIQVGYAGFRLTSPTRIHSETLSRAHSRRHVCRRQGENMSKE